jgi:superfamily II DNA or RNA helicase
MIKATKTDIENQINNLIKNNLLNSYLGEKGYSIYKVCLNDDIIKYIKSELTVKPFIMGSPTNNSPSFPVYQESDKKIYVPRFWGINTFGHPKSIKISYGTNINLTFNGSLREYQNNVINCYLKQINFNSASQTSQTNENISANSSALIELQTGGGKTVIAIKIIEILKKKTIIFVHKTFLKNQWIERINQFLPDAKIGTIQGQIIDIDDKDIVIAMIQSISMKSYPESLFDSFGFSIYDETHHMGSQVFSNCLKKCNTIYGLGLSATMNRKDGLTNVFKMYLGEICFKSESNQQEDTVLVKVINYKIDDDEEFNNIEYDFRGNIKYSTMISKLANYEYRNIFILNVLENELLVKPEQQFILLAHNKSLLNYLYKEINNRNFASVGFYIGGMKDQDLKKSESKKIILATYSMAAEALDIKSLTSLILATPKSDIVQSVGRILREKHEQPLIIDIVDSHDVFTRQFEKRKSLYKERNYKMIKTDNNQYINYIIEAKNNEKNNCFDLELLINKYFKTIEYKTRTKKNSSKDPKCLINI